MAHGGGVDGMHFSPVVILAGGEEHADANST